MKISSRSLVLLLSLLAAASAETVVVKGVDVNNVANSERFFDSGKGYYFSWSSTTTPMCKYFLETYKSDGYSFMGEWKNYLKSGSTTSDITANLQNDADTCWYQVASNCIQYWQTYYGIFGAADTPYGYAYDKKYVSGLGGTLSLNVGKYFYDNTANKGGLGEYAFEWYFSGHAVTSGLFESETGGFYTDWFSAGSTTKQDTWSGGAVTKSVFTKSVERALSQQGTLVSLSVAFLDTQGDRQGHALTLYGYETDANGEVSSLYLTNSDDREYTILQLYVGETDGKLMLYQDVACTVGWSFAGSSAWYIDMVEYIDTPETLVDLRKQYDTNALQWTGEKTVWDPADAENATLDVLPSGTGWGVEAGGTVYASWYQTDRDVAFTDAASSGTVESPGTVTLAADVKVSNMLVKNSALEYTFLPETTGVDLTVTGTLTKAGSGTAHLQVATTGGMLDVRGGTLSAEGVSVSFDEVQVAQGAVLGLCNGAALSATDSMTVAGIISVSGSGNKLTAKDLTLEEGALFRFDLSGLGSTGLTLSLTGTLIAEQGTVGLEALNGTNNNSYVLFSGADSAFFKALHSYSGTLTLSDSIITLTYQETPTWSSGSGTWTATETGSQLKDNTEPTLTSLALASGSSVRLENDTEGTTSLSLSGKVSMDWVTVAGQYKFSGAEAAFEHLTLAADASLASSVSFGTCAVELGTGATLSLSGANQQWSSLFMAADSELELRGETGYTVAVTRAGTLDGTLTVGEGNTLQLSAVQEVELAHLGGAGQVELLGEASFRLLDSEYFTGKLTVGETTQATVQVAEGQSTSFAVQSGGSLVLEGSGSLTQALTGSGTVRVAEGARLSFAGTEGLFGSNRLEVMGTATIGRADSTALSTDFADDVLVSGGSLTVYADPLQGASALTKVTLTVDKLELVDGHYQTVYNWSNGTYWTGNPVDGLQHIGTLSVSGEGVLGVSHVQSYSGRSMRTTIAQLSGDGTLRLENDSYYMDSVVKVADALAFTGDVQIAAVGNYVATGYYGVQALELANGELGTVSMELSLSAYRKVGLGLLGDVSVAGLDSCAAATYVYNGAYDSGGDIGASWADCVANDEEQHVLTIETEGTHSFAGAVLNGVDLYKTGNGTQRFTGDMSGFAGSVTVEAGTLSFAESDLSVDDLDLASGARLEAESVAVTGVYTVGSDSLEEYTPAVVDADLSLAAAQKVVVSLNGSAVSLEENTLTLSTTPVELVLGDVSPGLRELSSDLTLFTGVSELYLGGEVATYEVMKASDYFTGDWVQEDSLLIWKDSSLKLRSLSVPEPATASLSLAALAALALRRRRRS
ncbi:MAG: IdeS/Mac family cysteine endopeptidase [Akkermansia sp.]